MFRKILPRTLLFCAICLTLSTATTFAADQDQDKTQDQTKDQLKLKDGSCQTTDLTALLEDLGAL